MIFSRLFLLLREFFSVKNKPPLTKPEAWHLFSEVAAQMVCSVLDCPFCRSFSLSRGRSFLLDAYNAGFLDEGSMVRSFGRGRGEALSGVAPGF